MSNRSERFDHFVWKFTQLAEFKKESLSAQGKTEQELLEKLAAGFIPWAADKLEQSEYFDFKKAIEGEVRNACEVSG